LVRSVWSGRRFLTPLPHRYAIFGALLRDLRRQPSKPGTRVMAPGDPEKAEMSDRAAHGIPIDPVTWLTLQDLAGRHGLKAPTAIGGPASPPTVD
jgi:ureidoglycolate dehydrogenase (NAD+)